MRWDVHYVDETGSTNADLLGLARAGAALGTVLRAGHQTSGRGRLGRRWEASPGTSLLASILLAAEPAPFVAVARVALASSDACRDLAGVDAALKWPNDLVVDDRKLAGLLAEADAGSASMVVGVGCNVDWPPPSQLPAHLAPLVTSLSWATPEGPSPAALLDGLLARLEGWMDRVPDEVLAAYRGRCATLGTRVRVDMATASFEGRATGITSMGELEVLVGTATQVVRSGEVVHVRAR